MSSTSASAPPAAPWLAHLRREAERFAEVVAQSPLRVHVPAYPDFTVHSLAAHIGRALRLFRGIITTGSGEYQPVGAPDGEDVAGWVLAAVDPLVTHVPIPSDLAAQEVESVFANFVPRLAGSGVADIGGAVGLQTTDTAAAWSARVSDGRLVTERAPDGPSGTAVVVTGTAQDIALLVWKRAVPPRPELDVTGSAVVLKRFLATDYIPDPRTTPAH